MTKRLNSRRSEMIPSNFKFMSRIIWMLMGLLVYGSVAQASPPSEKMDSVTVLITCPKASGSGFLLDQGRHVVTNWHVAVKCVNKGTLKVIHQNGQKSSVGLRGYNERKDLAILDLKTPFSGYSAPLVPSNLVQKMDDIWVNGYPGAAFGIGDRNTSLEPTSTKGIISRKVTSNRVKMFQIDAAVNPGNSGGPVFNELGEIAGIATLKSQVEVMEVTPQGPQPVRVTLGEGIAWAVSADELMEELDELGIPYQVANTRPESGLVGTVTVDDRTSTKIAIAAAVLSLIAMLIAFTKQGRTIIKEVVNRSVGTLTPPSQPQLKENKSMVPELRGLSGRFSGVSVELDEQPLVVGRDPRVAQLVFPEGALNISKRHCVLTYDPNNKGLWVKDCWSTNGTFVNKNKLSSEHAKLLLPGECFYLANMDEKFMFSLDPKETA